MRSHVHEDLRWLGRVLWRWTAISAVVLPFLVWLDLDPGSGHIALSGLLATAAVFAATYWEAQA